MHSEPIRLKSGETIAQCRVCGTPAHSDCSSEHQPHAWRCRQHAGRNPCAIEGCSRSKFAKDGHLHDGRYWICGAHWRMACPPHSPERRAYNRFFRLGKKLDDGTGTWPKPLRIRFWRFWAGLVRRGRRRCAGDVDMAEINKLFGWDGEE